MAFHIVLYLLYFLEMIFLVSSQSTEPIKRSFDIEVRHFVYWPNGTVPFYINPNNFDKEQSLAIMLSLSMYSFKTCLKFVPVMADPGMEQHVLVFENPSGVRKCVIGMEGHGKDEPHRVTLGYDCLRSPEIDMIIMKALGFPFEHNRASRDVFVDVQFENIETDHIPLFTKEKILPPELRALPYDADSVMHFGERDFSKNGHRTIIFKNEKTIQKRIGLSATDLRKIAIVYGPECLARERQAKIDICRNYPVVRKRRDVDFATVGNLRVNPDITPPSDVQDQGNLTDDITNNLKELGIEDEVQTLIDQLHKITAAALQSAKLKHCNATDHNVTNTDSEKTPDLVDIISSVDKYARTVVQNALTNLTVFCDDANSMEMYQRGRCQWGLGNRCPVNYRSTMPGAVKYSTQHRPWIRQSTKHEGKGQKYSYAVVLRSINGTDSKNLTRSKRELNATVGATENIIIQTNASVKGDLRMATKILREKTTNYAPVRRNFRENYRDETKDFDVQEKQRKRKLKDPKRFEETRIEKLDEGDERPRQKIKESDQRQKEERYEGKDSEVQNKQRKRKLKILNPLGEEIRSEKSDKADERPRQKIMESYRETEGRPREKKIIKERKLFRVPQTVTLSKQNREFYAERMWPEGVVNYVIKNEPKYDINKVRDRLSEVNRILRRKTCARLKEITEEEADRVLDYLVLDSSRDYVTGRVGGKQNFGSLELFEGGQHRQHAAMMVMGMLGFYFEVSRHDRDKYIRVHNRHIRPDKLHHFEKIRSEATLPLPYDYRSATQPAWQFWRTVGKTGISTVATYKDQDPDGSIMRSLGQNEKLLSDNDLIKINSVYGVKCFQNQRRMKMRYTKTVE